jgi:hypothetical protein
MLQKYVESMQEACSLCTAFGSDQIAWMFSSLGANFIEELI